MSTAAFLLYSTISLTCLVLYTICFVKVFRNDSPLNKYCCDPMRFGGKTLIVLGMPFLNNSFYVLDSTIGTISYFTGQDLPCHFVIEIVLGFIIVLNLTTVNYFQLKIAGIAALQRCKTPEMEMKIVSRIKLAYRLYLPIYIFLTSVQYACNFLYLWSMNEKFRLSLSFELGLVICSNGVKMLFTGTLAFFALRFSSELKEIV